MSSPNSNLFLTDDYSSSLDTLDTLALNNHPLNDDSLDGFWDDLTDFTSTFDKTPSVSDKLSSGFCKVRNTIESLKSQVTSFKQANAVLQINLQSANDKLVNLQNQIDVEKNDKVQPLQNDPALLEQINVLEKSYAKEFTKTHIECFPLSTLNTFDLKHDKPNCHSLRTLSNLYSNVPTNQDSGALLDSLPYDVQQCINSKRPFYLKFDFHSKPILRKSLFLDLDEEFQSACKKFSSSDKKILINLSNNGSLDKKSFVAFARKRKLSARNPSLSPIKTLSKKQKN